MDALTRRGDNRVGGYHDEVARKIDAQPERGLQAIERRIRQAIALARALGEDLEGTANRVFDAGETARQERRDTGEPISRGSIPACLGALEELEQVLGATRDVAQRLGTV